MFFTKGSTNLSFLRTDNVKNHWSITLSCFILAWTSHSEKCSIFVSCRSISVSHTRMLSRAVSNSSRWPMKCWMWKENNLNGKVHIHTLRWHCPFQCSSVKSLSQQAMRVLQSVTIHTDPGYPRASPMLWSCWDYVWILNTYFQMAQRCLSGLWAEGRHSKDLESAQDGGGALLQVVPSLVAFVNHLLQATGRIRAVLSRQAAVLLVDEL